jgi:hypothetical protein
MNQGLCCLNCPCRLLLRGSTRSMPAVHRLLVQLAQTEQALVLQLPFVTPPPPPLFC